jgi:hypothetical protein
MSVVYRSILAAEHATRVIKGRRRGRHSTLAPLEELESIAKKHGITLTIIDTHVYAYYTSIVYEIN